MMLSSRASYTAARRCSHRNFTGHRPYSKNVRAFPFRITRDEAIEELSWKTSYLTAEKPLKTFLRRLFPNINSFDALRPNRIQAVYLPYWYTDAQLKASAWLKQNPEHTEFIKDTTEVQFTHTVLPGFVSLPLSAINLSTPTLTKTPTVPWAEELRKNEGEDVLCLPFSLSPLKVVEAARSLSLSDATISDTLRFDPSSVQDSMIAGYPVVIPVYIAQFTVHVSVDSTLQEVTVTSFMEAAHNEPRIFVEVIPEYTWIFDYLKLPIPSLLVRGLNPALSLHFAEVRQLMSSHATNNHRCALRRWIDTALTEGRALERYRDRFFGKSEREAARAVDWDDIRIRPFTEEERVANIAYIKTCQDLFLMELMRAAYERKHGSGGDSEDLAERFKGDAVNQDIKQLEELKGTQKPQWLAEYELQQRLLVPSADTGNQG